MPFDPGLIAEHEARVVRKLRRFYPQGLPQYSVDDTRALTASVEACFDDKGQQVTPYSEEQQRFIGMVSLRVMTIGDIPYFLERFVWIDDEGQGLRPLYPLWESQQLALEKLGAIERQRRRERSKDGILLNILKVRQVGITTLGVACVAYKALTQARVRALLGSDIEQQAGYMFRMADRIYENLPRFLKPGSLTFNKDRERTFSNGSSLLTAWGKTTRGALQEVGGQKGNIARGRTYKTGILSELATWDYPDQIDTALLPGIPVSRDTFWLFESTAELAGDWWNQHWDTSKAGQGRFQNLFIPNYAVPSKYSTPAPEGWTPKSSTLAWVQKAERESPQWTGGRTIHPTREQAYWYETTRAYYEQKSGGLSGFLKEYPSDDQECYQYAGTTVLTLEQHEYLSSHARPLKDVWAVEPSREIAALRRDLPSPEGDTRVPPPISMRMSRAEAETYPVPPGYGFRRLSPDELQTLLSSSAGLKGSVLSIWEYPRVRGPRRYVLGVDVAYGVGGDSSTIDVIRQPTIEEPAEQVAQYVSNVITPTQLAWVIDAVGRLYVDEEGLEALVAIELNMGPGLSAQDTLQLHLGYTHFYTWEYANVRDPDRRFSTRVGWYTTPQTRPILMSHFIEMITQVDAISGLADLQINSPITRQELRHLIIPQGGTLGQAEAAQGQHDDCVMSGAIGSYVAHRLAGGEAEPINERRRRRTALEADRLRQGVSSSRVDFRNSAYTSEEQEQALAGVDPDAEEDDAGLHFRSSDAEW